MTPTQRAQTTGAPPSSPTTGAPARPPASTPPPPGAPSSPCGSREEREEAARRSGIWARSGLPRLHRDRAARREEVGAPWLGARGAVLAAALEGKIIALVGERGTGKTQLGASVCAHACFVHGLSVAYYRIADLIAEFKHAVYGDGDSEYAWMRRMASPRVMVLDEVQDRYDSQTEATVLARLIDHRYGETRGTIVIGNLAWPACAAMLGPSVTSRIEESGMVIECDWGSYRRNRP